MLKKPQNPKTIFWSMQFLKISDNLIRYNGIHFGNTFFIADNIDLRVTFNIVSWRKVEWEERIPRILLIDDIKDNLPQTLE